MKKHFIITSALMALFMMASCSEEDMPQGQVSGDFVTFKVAVPQISTRAISDGYTANRLYWGVYDHEGRFLPEISNIKNDGKDDMVFSRSGEVKLTLAQDKDYSIVFWAANESNSMCHVDWDGRCMSVEPKEANQESYDAFCAYVEINNVSGYKTQEVKLYRPFAQLNIGTADYDKAAASGLTVQNTKIKVSGIPDKYNFVDGSTEGEYTMVYDYPQTPVSFEGETFPVNGYEYLAMNYILVEKDKELVTVNLSYLDDDAQEHERTYTSVPLQRNWRTNIYGNILTSETDFTVEILPGFGEDGEEDVANVVSVSTAEQLLKALASAEKETVKIVMLNDITLDGGTSAYSTEAKEVIIEGSQTSATRNSNNGKKPTLTFKDSYRTYIKLANPEGKITFNNVNINRESTGGTHWHDNNMKFCSNAEFNNVAFNKGICLDDAKTFVLNNCSINKGKVATYGMFITAGCNVTIDGLSITHSESVAGRGIKIVDEDVANKEALTTLSVSNATFVTEAKAAILVGSQGGANITLENINLAGVKADGFNAVWVDEDYKDYADKVTVDGGFCKVEDAEDNAENNPFLVENGTVTLPSGHFVMPAKAANGLTIEGATDGTTVLDMTGANPSGVSGLTFKNVTLNVSTEYYHGITHSSGLAYNNCVINGTLWLYSTASFTDCTFNVEGDAYNVWTYGSTEATFERCTFNCDGKSVLVYNEGGNGSVVTMNQCSFVAGKAVDGKAAVEIDSSLLPEGKQFVVNLNDCSAEGFGRGSVSNNMLFNHKKGSKASVFVDEIKAVSTIAELNAATETEIYLAGKFFGDAILAKSGKTYLGYDGGVVGCVNLNGADNVTLSGIKFDAAKAKLGYDGKGTAKQPANIITGDNVNKPNKGAHNLVVEACTFQGTFADGGVAIAFTDQNRGSGASGNVTIKNCIFDTQDGYCDIYGHYCGDGRNGHGDFVIEQNAFNSAYLPNGNPVYLGRYASSTPVVVKENQFNTVSTLEKAVYLQDHSNYGVSINASGNSFGN